MDIFEVYKFHVLHGITYSGKIWWQLNLEDQQIFAFGGF